MAHLDKFKRRLIRSVARLLLQEKKPPDVVWEELKKETGCECEILWGRMKALTIKKLDRLIAADDRTDSIAAVARLSLTDWLLFDLVLVHEKLDVIASERTAQRKVEYKPLMELFSLVQRFDIEGRSGDILANAWAAATIYYNQNGRQCSPMLLQRRWYQMKEASRTSFYKFWVTYRGQSQLLPKAKEQMPTRLQMAIARRYPHVITDPFADWEDLISKRMVILPDKFEGKMNMKNLPKPCDANDPDLVVVEPVIETIEINCDSDSDDKSTLTNDQDNIDKEAAGSLHELEIISTDIDLGITVKQEPVEEFDKPASELDAVELVETIPLNSREKLKETIKNVEDSLTRANIKVEMGELEPIAIENEAELPNPPNTLETELVDHRDQLNETAKDVIDSLENTVIKVEINELELIDNEEASSSLVNSSTAFDVETESLNSKEKLKQSLNDELDVSKEIYTDSNKSSTIVEYDHNQIDRSKCLERRMSDVEKPRGKCLKVTNVRSDGMLPKISNVIGNAKFIESQITVTAAPNSVDLKRSSHNKAKKSQVYEVSNIYNTEASEVASQINDQLHHNDLCGSSVQLPNNEIKIVAHKPTEIVTESAIDNKYCQKIKETLPLDDNMSLIDNIIELKTANYLQALGKQAESSKRVDDVNMLLENKFDAASTPYSADVLPQDNLEDLEDIIKIKTENFLKKEGLQEGASFFDLSSDLTLVDDGIQFVDDGIEYVEEGDKSNFKGIDATKTECLSDTNIDETIESEGEETQKFDMKLLMSPVVYTLKLDDMDVFRNRQFISVTDKNIIDNVIKESKPISSEISYTEQEKDFYDLYSEEDQDSQLDSPITVTDKQKIKINSNLLQKPRNRSYNPIQLCKNPDFNTRLKRLTVGFFSSMRNRLLLKGCKPMTIDVHKGFESKLINGTIYLKSVENNPASSDLVVSEDNDNETVTVIPSAMPVQSLIDNTKLQDLIQSESEKYMQSKLNEENLFVERRKVITLPDIASVRRINQQLLTAEVTPIRVHNNEETTHNNEEIRVHNMMSKQVLPTTEMKVVEDIAVVDGDINECSSVGNEIENNQLQSQANNVDSSDIIETHQIDSTRITQPEQFPIQNVLADGNNVSTSMTQTQNKCTVVDKEKNTAKVTEDNLINQRNVAKDKPAKVNAIEKPKKYTSKPVTTVPWIKRHLRKTESMDDFLLTGDTLNKILHILNGGKSQDEMSKEDKWRLKKDKKEVKSTSKKQTVNSNSVGPVCDTGVKGVAKTRRSKKFKECSTSKPEVESTTVNETLNTIKPKVKILTTEKLDKCQDKPTTEKLEKYQGNSCCWARDSIKHYENVELEMAPHTCPFPVCLCCCRNALVRRALHKINHLENKNNVAGCIVVSDDEDNLKNACKSIETVVQESREMFETPTASKILHNSLAYRKCPCNTVDNSLNVSNDVARASTPTDGTFVADGCVLEVNKIQIRPLNSNMPVNDSSENNVNVNNCRPLQLDDIPPTLSTQIDPQNYVDNSFKNIEQNRPFYKSKLRPRRRLTHIHSSTVSDKPLIALQGKKRQIIIDGRGIPTENKNKVLYMNSSQITSNTTTPIFVGKNTILLTTVKMPQANTSFSNVDVKANNKVIPTLSLPPGVQLVLLPNGELTYVVEPSVEIDPVQMENLPAILSAVQEQLNSTLVSKQINMLQNKDSTNQGVEDSTLESVSTDEAANTDHVSETDNIDLSTNNSEVISNNEVPGESSLLKEINKSDEKMLDVTQANTENKCNTYNEGVPEANKNNNVTYSQIVENNDSIQNETNAEEVNSQLCDQPNGKSCETTKENEQNSSSCNDTTENVSKKTILSDLMAMSGISEEDSTSVVQETTLRIEDVAIPQESLFSSEIPQYCQDLPVNLDSDTNNVSESALLNSQTVTNLQSGILSELTPITSFAELKYAYENNGKFFKLDFETGVIVPIKVCIKRNTKSNRTMSNFSLDPSAVVDLTDETNINEDSPHAHKPSAVVSYTINTQNVKRGRGRPRKYFPIANANISIETTAKQCKKTNAQPVKLFKAVHPIILNNKRKIGDKYSVGPKNIENGNSFKYQKRKQSKIEAKIDLVDSDAPMEEEYLVDSTDSDDNMAEEKKAKLKRKPLDEDSSDDEPLAKIIKKRDEAKATSEHNEQPVEVNLEKTVGGIENDTTELESENIIKNNELEKETSTKPVTPTLEFLSDISETEDNCILGV